MKIATARCGTRRNNNCIDKLLLWDKVEIEGPLPYAQLMSADINIVAGDVVNATIRYYVEPERVGETAEFLRTNVIGYDWSISQENNVNVVTVSIPLREIVEDDFVPQKKFSKFFMDFFKSKKKI
jgi:hypothetical protein